ncbi:MAG: hypothetical protein JXA74_02040 [Anaerolineae bacterium]|nr:hypothetical protein [Anaerolineae bacterium]
MTKSATRSLSLLAMLFLLALALAVPAHGQGLDASPPAEPVKLIFIHHSTGGNWLADPSDDQPSGGLGIALRDNNYFVSATNYSWGPNDIGDRTDIPNWPEWFGGPESERYLRALYTENGQNIGDFGRWSRLAQDPGGENEIVMFKSCFPNSDLYGNPTDPPAGEPGDEMTVSNAKAVYNRLLTYFETRQDKLFVVITAPPMADFDYGGGDLPPAQRAANARAFNNWLVAEWLGSYPYANVAVFDYFNVLTSSGGSPEVNDLRQEGGNHHRWRDGQIEHIQTVDNNFSSYPSGDSHPSSAGHQKATAEFVPLLNVFYNRWKEGAGAAVPAIPAPQRPAQPTPAQAPTEAAEPAPSEGEAPPPPAAGAVTGLIEGWEGENYWECNGDDQGSTIESAVDSQTTYSGNGALRMAYNVVATGWGDCGTSFPSPADLSGGTGLALALHSDTAGQPLVLMLFSGSADGPTPFVADLETTEESVSDWAAIIVPWEAFGRAPWSDEGGLNEIDPQHIVGMGLSFMPGEGTLWLDDVGLFTGEAVSQEAAPEVAKEEAQPAPTGAPGEAPTAEPLPAATAAQQAAKLADTPAQQAAAPTTAPVQRAAQPAAPSRLRALLYPIAFVLVLAIAAVAFFLGRYLARR